MKRSCWRLGLMLVAVLPLLPASGCTDSERLSGTFEVQFVTRVFNTEGSFFPWECVTMDYLMVDVGDFNLLGGAHPHGYEPR